MVLCFLGPVTVARERFDLRKTAVPCIFPNLPSYLSKCLPSRPDPENRKRRIDENDEARFEKFLEEDMITSFDDFKKGMEKKAPSSMKCQFKEGSDGVCVFTLSDKPESSPIVPFFLKVYMNLSIMLSINGMEVLEKDYSFILSNNRLTRWSQLDSLWSCFKNGLPCVHRSLVCRLASKPLGVRF